MVVSPHANRIPLCVSERGGHYASFLYLKVSTPHCSRIPPFLGQICHLLPSEGLARRRPPLPENALLYALLKPSCTEEQQT